MDQHHEDNAHYENIVVHNSQNLMENSPFGNQQGEVVSFAAVGDQSEAMVTGAIDIGCALVDNAGYKLDEHGDDDDEELKYIKEKHQNEKQHHHPHHQQHYDLLKGIGNGDGRNGDNADDLMENFDGKINEHHIVGNGDSNSANGESTGDGHTNKTGELDEDEVEIIKNDGDGDGSIASNATTSTTQSPGDERDVAADLLQVEMKIEQAAQGYMAHGAQEELDEEEPSSLATNGTSSLSENQQAKEPQLFSDDAAFGVEQLTELNFDHHSALNPEAKEFVPSFGGSKPTSPTGRRGPADFDIDAELLPEQSAGDVARHILGPQHHADDFLAQSPHKSRCVDMETISIPAENEFENEAARRPHELEKEELLLGDDKNGSGDGGDTQDFNRQSPASFIDHGPETCVDNLDNDIMTPMQPIDDVMKQSIYVENTQNKSEEQIEDILNSVQPLPTDSESLNESFTEEQNFAQQMNYEREILNSYDIEHVNQMNLQNNLDTEAMEEEQCTVEQQPAQNTEPAEFTDLQEENQQQEEQHEQEQQLLGVEERSFLMDTSSPLESNNVSLLSETEASFEAVLRTHVSNVNEPMFEEQLQAAVLPPNTLSIGVNEAHDPYKYSGDDNTDLTPSPHSTEEKHLVEETKEAHQLFGQDDLQSLENKFNDMNMNLSNDDNLAQMEPTVEIAEVINENENPFFVSDHELPSTESHGAEQKPEDDEPIQHELHQNEQRIPTNEPVHEEQIEQHPIEEQQPHEQQQPHEVATEAFELTPEPTKLELEPETVVVGVTEEAVREPEPAMAPATTLAEEPAPPPTAAEETSAVETAAVAVAAGAAATAAVGAVAKRATIAGAGKKPATAKPSTTATNAAKPRTSSNSTTSDAKKQVEAKKSTTSGVAAKAAASSAAVTARPRTAPIAKRSIEKTAPATAAAAAAATATEKPAVAARKTFTARPAPRTTASSAQVRPTTAPSGTRSNATNATKTSAVASARSSTSVRKAAAPAATTTSTGLSSVKSRVNTSGGGDASAPTKPTTLGVGAHAAKPKHISPRATLTSQLRKTSGGGVTHTGVGGGAKSPNKPTAAATMASAKPSVASLAARTKTTAQTHITSSTAAAAASTTTTTTTTTTTKRFVARPAPKYTAPTSTTTAAARRPAGAGATNGPSKTSVASKRLLSPSKAAHATKLSPTAAKSASNASAAIKSPKSPKAKEETAVKSAQELKQMADVAEPPKTNGTAIEEPQLNGNSGVENGIHTLVNNEVIVEQHTTEIINLIDD